MLVIALEPEAASLYCRNLSTGQFSVKGTGESMIFKTRSKYLVVDAGGILIIISF